MKKLALFGALAFMPLLASAQLDNVQNIATAIGRIINILVPIVFALAMLFFFWGLALYIFGSEHDKEKAKKTMLWGVIAIFVMAAVWGLVQFIGDAFDIGVGEEAGFNVGGLVPDN